MPAQQLRRSMRAPQLRARGDDMRLAAQPLHVFDVLHRYQLRAAANLDRQHRAAAAIRVDRRHGLLQCASDALVDLAFQDEIDVLRAVNFGRKCEVRRDKNYAAGRSESIEPLCETDPVHLAHLNIQHRDVRRVAGNHRLEQRFGAVKAADIRAARGERAVYQLRRVPALYAFIVTYRYAKHRSCPPSE